MNRRTLTAIAALLLLGLYSFAQQAQETQPAPRTQPPQGQATGTGKQAPATEESPQPTRGKRSVATKAPAQARTQGQPWERIPIPKLPAFNPRHPVRVQLPNGMVIFLQEDHELPLIDVTMRIRGGSRVEPANKIGLVDLYGEVWRTGGTTTKTGDQMDDFLEARAAKIETDGAVDSTRIGMNCLKQDFDPVFDLMVELLRQPAFRDDKLELAKRQMETSISRRNDEIGSISGRESTRLGYGKNNPYARIAEYATVDAVGKQDLIDWHQRYVHPNNILLGVVGDFNARQMEARLRQAFESWPKGPQAEPPQIAFNEPKPGLYFIPKEDVNQSEISMVALGINRKNPDYFALVVMNEVLGGGFAGRLVKTIRTAKGLAYSVGGGVGSSWDHPGLIRLGMGTKTATTAESIQALYAEVDNMTKVPPTDEELRLAKDAILNRFVFNFDSPEKIMGEQMTYEFYGYPSDFLERYRAGIEKTTAADVFRVAQKYLHRNELAVLVVGQPEVEKQMAELGPVQMVDITIPPPPGAQGATKAETAQPATPK